MENNVVLYRKYRPQSFSEIIGQEHVTKTLTNSLAAGSIAHAYLLCGPRGSGKTTIARLFAKAINCSSRQSQQAKADEKPVKSEPCNKCDSCLEIMAGNSLDLVEIDAASHTGVDEVRSLIEGIQFAPVKSKYKIFIIDECHQLSKSAANALLKTLEEPPAHAIFILATTEAHKMIATIVSRCQRFDFKKLSLPFIIKKLEFILKKEGIAYEDGVLPLIAFNARGSFRDAESLLDKCINFTAQDKKITVQEIKDLLGIVEVGQIEKLMSSLVQKDVKTALASINHMAQEGTDLQEFAKTLVFYVRHLLLLKISPALLNAESSGFSAEEVERMKAYVVTFSEKDIQRMLELCIQAENKMKYASLVQLPLELAIIDITHKES